MSNLALMPGFDDLRQRYIGRARVGYARAGAVLESDLRSTGPVRTGELVRKTRVTPQGPLRLRVTVDVPYASFVRDGTPPHPIAAKNRTYLAFAWPKVAGDERFRRLPDGRVLLKRVNHPGTKANPWYDRALNQFRTVTIRAELNKIPL